MSYRCKWSNTVWTIKSSFLLINNQYFCFRCVKESKFYFKDDLWIGKFGKRLAVTFVSLWYLWNYTCPPLFRYYEIKGKRWRLVSPLLKRHPFACDALVLEILRENNHYNNVMFLWDIWSWLRTCSFFASVLKKKKKRVYNTWRSIVIMKW